jgi:hypothetical protein
MAKGDNVTVKSEIGGKLEKDDLKVTGAGGQIEVEWKKDQLIVQILGRTGKIRSKYTYALSAVRSVQEVRRDDEG